MTTAPLPTGRKHGYSSTQIALHWTVAALVAANWLLGGAMERAFEALHEGGAEAGVAVPMGGAYSHIAIGLAVLLLMIGRLIARVRRPVEVAPESPHRLLATVARINHLTFYALLLMIPVLGAIAWFGGSEAAGGLHKLGVTVLLALIAVHVAGALFEHFVLKDGVIRRMLRATGGT